MNEPTPETDEDEVLVMRLSRPDLGSSLVCEIEEAKIPDYVQEEIRLLITDSTTNDKLQISKEVMGREEFEEMDEFTGW